jgi:hypothetical protein
MTAKKLTVKLVRDKETPGTIRYAEVPDEETGKYAGGVFDAPAVGTQYVKKHAARALGDPKVITITIETVPE